MSHTIQDLRAHLFATLDGLRDKANPMDIERAKAVADVAQAIINSAKVEVEHLKVTGQSDGTGFIPMEDKTPNGPGVTKDPVKATSTTVSLLQGGGLHTVHKAK